MLKVYLILAMLHVQLFAQDNICVALLSKFSESINAIKHDDPEEALEILANEKAQALIANQGFHLEQIENFTRFKESYGIEFYQYLLVADPTQGKLERTGIFKTFAEIQEKEDIQVVIIVPSEKQRDMPQAFSCREDRVIFLSPKTIANNEEYIIYHELGHVREKKYTISFVGKFGTHYPRSIYDEQFVLNEIDQFLTTGKLILKRVAEMPNDPDNYKIVDHMDRHGRENINSMVYSSKVILTQLLKELENKKISIKTAIKTEYISPYNPDYKEILYDLYFDKDLTSKSDMFHCSNDCGAVDLEKIQIPKSAFNGGVVDDKTFREYLEDSLTYVKEKESEVAPLWIQINELHIKLRQLVQ